MLNNSTQEPVKHDIHHEHLIEEISEMYARVFSDSPQAVYIYLDDTHKICNRKFAALLGYKSVQEWVNNEYPVSDVEKNDRDKVIKAYMDASRKMKASSLPVTVVNKKGQKIKVNVIMAPVTYKDETFVIHFINALN